jgi:hypothetical protein
MFNTFPGCAFSPVYLLYAEPLFYALLYDIGNEKENEND